MKIRNNIQALGFLFILVNSAAVGGIFDPDCTAGKAARSAAMKATVGVGGRCSPAEAAKDTAKGVAGIEDKGPLRKSAKKTTSLKKEGENYWVTKPIVLHRPVLFIGSLTRNKETEKILKKTQIE